LGFISSIVTAIVAAIILVSIVAILPLDRKSEIRLVILACFAIGLGAVITPIGEPLSSIVVSKLDVEFFYLLTLLDTSVVPMVVIFRFSSVVLVKSKEESNLNLDVNMTYTEMVVVDECVTLPYIIIRTL